MRLLTLVAFGFTGFLLSCAAPTSSNDVTDASGEAPPLSQNNDEQQHRRLKFYNWDYKDLGTIAFEDIGYPARQPPGAINQSEHCPNGWVRFADSCYWIEKSLLSFSKAERNCFEKQSTLFVANSDEEWNSVRNSSQDSYFSWIGLVRFSHYEKAEQLPRWQTEGAVNPANINWLSRPYKPLFNGWTQLANCAASYKSLSDLESASYTFYYPCTYLFHSICERNSTIVNALQ